MDRAGLLAVRAQHLLALRDEPRLLRRHPAALHQQPRLDAGLAADEAGEVRAGLIVADHRDEGDGGADGDEIAHDVARAAGDAQLAMDAQDRDRRLAADPLDIAIDVAVQHRVADDQGIGPAEAANRVGQRR